MSGRAIRGRKEHEIEIGQGSQDNRQRPDRTKHHNSQSDNTCRNSQVAHDVSRARRSPGVGGRALTLGLKLGIDLAVASCATIPARIERRWRRLARTGRKSNCNVGLACMNFAERTASVWSLRAKLDSRYTQVIDHGRRPWLWLAPRSGAFMRGIQYGRLRRHLAEGLFSS